MITKLKGKKAIGIVIVQFFSKVLGILREIIIANFFGGSVLFSDYLKLMSYGHLIAIFYTDSGLSANLMKKFALMNKRKASFLKIRSQSLKLAVVVSIFVGVIQLIAWKFIISSTYNFSYIIILSSLASGMVFYFNIGQIILISKSNYSNLYKSTFFRSAVYVTLLYPLLFFFGILGSELNRLFSVFTQYFNSWKVVNKDINENQGKPIGMSFSDFNLWVFLTNNSIFLWFVLLRVYFSFFDGIEIIYLTYGYVLASSFDSMIIKSFSVYLLERSVNVSFNIKRTVVMVSIVSAIVILFSILFGSFAINIIFGLGKFSQDQLLNIFYYFIVLLVLVSTNGICNLVFQKVFSGRRKIQFYHSKRYMIISLITLMIVTIFIVVFQVNHFYYLVSVTGGFSIINLFYIFKLIDNDRNIQ